MNVGKPNGAFSDDHCKTEEAGGTWKHEAVAEKTTTELTGNNNGEVSKLKSTIGGVGVTLTATELTGTGTMSNQVAGSGEHFASGEGTITYSNVTVSVPKCVVWEDVQPGGTVGTEKVVKTEPLTATTLAQGHSLKFTPKTGTVFARFWLTDSAKRLASDPLNECNVAGTYVVSGSVTGKVFGATTVTTHNEVTTANTLKMGPTEAGAKAGIEGTLALEGRANSGQGYKPLSATTVTT